MSTQTTPTTDRAAELMRRSFEAVAAREPDEIVRVDDERTVADFIALGREYVGADEIRGFFIELFAAVPDSRFETVRILDVDDDTAVGEWRFTGTFSGGPFQGIEPTGRPLEIRGVDIMEFEAGVLRRNTVFYDGLAFARQIGMLPAQDSAGDRAMMAAFNAFSRAKRRLGR